ncbi:aspartate dehydrogenase [Caballeronia sp. LZ032]|uniref:aspartate dehydrogenase n=1 Tax=Caballeronia sp. LZ032 TaxID=3038565 RepID=UPI002865D6B5|nr:aspartate dehydrogenase [Caballeronia sp. LZ032]MDR5880398.1 aspartate dehydrogenase [Caballeronia sp. LZ032]
MNQKQDKQALRVGIAGLGTVGKSIAKAIDTGIDGLELAAVSVRDASTAGAWLAELRHTPRIVSFDEMPLHADVVIECAPSQLLPKIAEPMLRAGKTLVPLSVGALLDHMELIEIARENGGQISVPTGALLGLDAVTAAAKGKIHSARMVTRKPVTGLLGAPFLEENNIRIDDIKTPTRIFSGTPRDAAKGFPANLNVSVALSLAGIGPDDTQLEIWADPALTRNTHTIEIDSDSARFTMTIENIPSSNPKTGLITALSVIALLEKMRAPLRVGT